ncbi:hypothetical protein [Mycolicibacterium hodleri]|uniref:Uncharacterized protein n=1 Tax=Mycolicibacterium hodleri TaxID=49897 RepID=A0A502DWV5_9MYCO|nr:hypothetical protein [Mycolicibacterium hodleri]TPG29863.1 hypothetical protein EAH80_25565 [Mycolicibacterium hodleri]
MRDGYAGTVLSELTVGWLILAAALVTFAGGLGLRSHVGSRPNRRVGRMVRRFRESAVGGVLYGPIASDARDPEELDQTILMPTIVLGCGFLLTAIFLIGYEILT